MARHSVPSFTDLWQKHETIYVGLFCLALQRLSEYISDTADEDTISEQLCPVLNEICFEENQAHNREISVPDWEKPVQPTTLKELKGGKIKKRPDFTCKLINTFAACAEEYELQLHVECKRVGNPTSGSWKLNENYVVNGIKRFDCDSHEYGKRAPSGIMIGYVISMSPMRIVSEINGHQKKHCPHNPVLTFNFRKKNVREGFQNLNRKNVRPNHFKLFHLWVDLRACSATKVTCI